MWEKVAPRRGAWIETGERVYGKNYNWVAPRRGAWIETKSINQCLLHSLKSHPAGVRGLKLQ